MHACCFKFQGCNAMVFFFSVLPCACKISDDLCFFRRTSETSECSLFRDLTFSSLGGSAVLACTLLPGEPQKFPLGIAHICHVAYKNRCTCTFQAATTSSQLMLSVMQNEHDKTTGFSLAVFSASPHKKKAIHFHHKGTRLCLRFILVCA